MLPPKCPPGAPIWSMYPINVHSCLDTQRYAYELWERSLLVSIVDLPNMGKNVRKISIWGSQNLLPGGCYDDPVTVQYSRTLVESNAVTYINIGHTVHDLHFPRSGGVSCYPQVSPRCPHMVDVPHKCSFVSGHPTVRIRAMGTLPIGLHR